MEAMQMPMGMMPDMGPPENTIKLACLDLASKANPDQEGDAVLETAKKFYEWVSAKS